MNTNLLRSTIKDAWRDCYRTMIPKDSSNENEEMEVYKAWAEWYEMGQMQLNPMYNIVLGYCLARGAFPEDITDDLANVQKEFTEQGHKALKEMIEETHG